jgi:transposase
MGNRYLRKLLVVGAHAVLYNRKGHDDALRTWASKLMETKPFKLVAVALANKLRSCATERHTQQSHSALLRHKAAGCG